MTYITCPACHQGEIELKVDVAPRTFYYPGHCEVEVLEQSCTCDLSGVDLYEDAMSATADDHDSAYDQHVEDQLMREMGE